MEEEKYTRMVQTYLDMVYRFALCYTKSQQDANDVVQEVFLKLYTLNPEFSDAEHERRWLLHVTSNLSKNYLNVFWNKNTKGLGSDEEQYSEIKSVEETQPEENYIGKERRKKVFDAVMSLAPKYRVCIYMYYFEEYSTVDISKILSVNTSTIRSRLKRARKLLNEMLKEWYDEQI